METPHSILYIRVGPICRGLFRRCIVVSTEPQASAIQDTKRVVRLAKAQTGRALPVCKIPMDHICLVSYGDASGGSTPAEQSSSWVRCHDCRPGFFGRNGSSCDSGVLEITSCPTWCTNASATEAMGLSEAIAQGDWIRAQWSEVVLGSSLREWREQEKVPPLISVTDSKSNYDHLHNETVGPSEDRRSAVDLASVREGPTKTTDVLALGGWRGSSGRCLDQASQ